MASYFAPWVPSASGPGFGGPGGTMQWPTPQPEQQPEPTLNPAQPFQDIQGSNMDSMFEKILKEYPKYLEMNEQLAIRQDQRTRELRKTQYQDLMEDLDKAGLNPTLLFGGGMGMQTPLGATAQTGMPNLLSGGLGDLWESKEKRDTAKTIFGVLTSIALTLAGIKGFKK